MTAHLTSRAGRVNWRRVLKSIFSVQ